MKTRTSAENRLLRDLTEIKAVLDVEAQLIQALVRMARQREILGFVA
jgi:hypothetical protein